MDLQSYGIRMEGNSLVNADGMVINEMDKITISSKHQTIYKGVAKYKPARFTKFLNGEEVAMEPEEVSMFVGMKAAYQEYQSIVNSQRTALISDVNKLARIIRCELQSKPDAARELVNNWYADNSDLYVEQVLESKMGDHQDQSRVFNFLDDRLKIDFFQRASKACMNRRLSGLKAGSFMLGRFVARPLSKKVWNSLSNTVVAFLLNEYVLYEKYLHVLEEVGEIKLARAHSRIETEGIDNMIINNFDMRLFIPLLFSAHDMAAVAHDLEQIEHQDNTHLLIEKLSRPIDQIFDMTKPWVVAEIEEKKRL